MSQLKVAINGFGRIGRVTTRLLQQEKDIEIVAINDLTPPEQNVHLLKYDSVHGPLNADVKYENEHLVVGPNKVKLLSQRDPAELPWSALGVDLVFECTGIFTQYDMAQKHLKAGAKKVIISAPIKETDKIPTFVMGINHDKYDPSSHHIVSNASCTTNCLAPMVKVLHDNFKVERGLMTTIHSYTNDQRILDLGHKDYRRMRAAAVNMIPTSTGAAKAVGLVIPELQGKLTGLAVRVPTPNVSLTDFVATLSKPASVEQINDAYRSAAQEGPLKGVLSAVDAPLVSSDYNGAEYSSNIDLGSTMVVDNNMVKVLSWYDNETGFSRRMIDLANLVGKSL